MKRVGIQFVLMPCVVQLLPCYARPDHSWWNYVCCFEWLTAIRCSLTYWATNCLQLFWMPLFKLKINPLIRLFIPSILLDTGCVDSLDVKFHFTLQVWQKLNPSQLSDSAKLLSCHQILLSVNLKCCFNIRWIETPHRLCWWVESREHNHNAEGLDFLLLYAYAHSRHAS